MKLLQVTRLALFFTLLVASAQSAERRTSTTTSEGFNLEVPENCKSLGFCDDIPNYPHELAKKVIDELLAQGKIEQDDLYLPDATRRLGPAEENIEICKYKERVLYPKIAVDLDGEWNIVLNNNDKPTQGFNVEICENESTEDALQKNEGEWRKQCSKLAMFSSGYEGRCKQKFVYHKIIVLRPDGTHFKKYLKIPSCCVCLAKVVTT